MLRYPQSILGGAEGSILGGTQPPDSSELQCFQAVLIRSIAAEIMGRNNPKRLSASPSPPCETWFAPEIATEQVT